MENGNDDKNLYFCRACEEKSPEELKNNCWQVSRDLLK
jgi:hypothetical protein